MFSKELPNKQTIPLDGQIILTVDQFAQCLALNEIPSINVNKTQHHCRVTVLNTNYVPHRKVCDLPSCDCEHLVK